MVEVLKVRGIALSKALHKAAHADFLPDIRRELVRSYRKVDIYGVVAASW